MDSRSEVTPNRDHVTNVSQLVGRAVAVLRALASGPGPVGVNELARRLGLAPATTHRILTALVMEGFARQSPDSAKYEIGSEVIPLAMRYLNERHLGPDCVPIMRQLAGDSGESVNLGVRSGTSIHYVQQVEGPNPLRFSRDIGLSVPLYCSALGKCLLAFTSEPCRSSLLGRLTMDKHTDQTITNQTTLLKELTEVARLGYAVDMGENVENLIGIAVPVRDWSGAVVAGLSVMGPSMRLTQRRIAYVVPKVIAGGEMLSHHLGWHSGVVQTLEKKMNARR